MTLRFTRSEVNPNHCFKVVDDRPLILVPYVDNLFPAGTDPLICKSKRELDTEFGMMDYKPVTTQMELNFCAVMLPDLIWEMPLSFLTHSSIDVLGELQSGYMFCN